MMDDLLLDFDLDFLSEPHNDKTVEYATLDPNTRSVSLARKKIIAADALIKKFYEKKEALEISDKNLYEAKVECKQICLNYRDAMSRIHVLEENEKKLQLLCRELEDKYVSSENRYSAIQSHANQLQELVKELETKLQSMEVDISLEKDNAKEFHRKALALEKDKESLQSCVQMLRNAVAGKSTMTMDIDKHVSKFIKTKKGEHNIHMHISKNDCDDNASVTTCNSWINDDFSDGSEEFEESTNVETNALEVITIIEQEKLSPSSHDSDCAELTCSEDTGRGSSIAASDGEKCLHSPEYPNNKNNGLATYISKANAATSPIKGPVTRHIASSPIKFCDKKDIAVQTVEYEHKILQNIGTSPIKCEQEVQEKSTKKNLSKLFDFSENLTSEMSKCDVVSMNCDTDLGTIKFGDDSASECDLPEVGLSEESQDVKPNFGDPLCASNELVTVIIIEEDLEADDTNLNVPANSLCCETTPIVTIKENTEVLHPVLESESEEQSLEVKNVLRSTNDIEVCEILKTMSLGFELLTPMSPSPKERSKSPKSDIATCNIEHASCPEVESLKKDNAALHASIASLTQQFMDIKSLVLENINKPVELNQTKTSSTVDKTVLSKVNVASDKLVPIANDRLSRYNMFGDDDSVHSDTDTIESDIIRIPTPNPFADYNTKQMETTSSQKIDFGREKVDKISTDCDKNDSVEWHSQSPEKRKRPKLSKLEKMRNKLIPKPKILNAVKSPKRFTGKVTKKTQITDSIKILSNKTINDKAVFEKSVKIWTEFKKIGNKGHDKKTSSHHIPPKLTTLPVFKPQHIEPAELSQNNANIVNSLTENDETSSIAETQLVVNIEANLGAESQSAEINVATDTLKNKMDKSVDLKRSSVSISQNTIESQKVETLENKSNGTFEDEIAVLLKQYRRKESYVEENYEAVDEKKSPLASCSPSTRITRQRKMQGMEIGENPDSTSSKDLLADVVSPLRGTRKTVSLHSPNIIKRRLRSTSIRSSISDDIKTLPVETINSPNRRNPIKNDQGKTHIDVPRTNLSLEFSSCRNSLPRVSIDNECKRGLRGCGKANGNDNLNARNCPAAVIDENTPEENGQQYEPLKKKARENALINNDTCNSSTNGEILHEKGVTEDISNRHSKMVQEVNNCVQMPVSATGKHLEVVNYVDLSLFTEDEVTQVPTSDKQQASVKDSILCCMIKKYGRSKVKYPRKKVSDKITNSICETIENDIEKISQLEPEAVKDAMDELVDKLQPRPFKEFMSGFLSYLNKPERKMELLSKVCVHPAPPMSKAEQVLIYVISQLNNNWHNINLIEEIFRNIEYTLFKLNNTPEFNIIESMSHFYAVLCRFTKAKNRLRLFILDAMYCIAFKSIPLIRQCIDVWMHVLPLAHMGTAKNPLVTCMVYLLHFYKCEDHMNRVQDLRHLLQKKYSYNMGEWTEDKLVELIRNCIMELREISAEKKMLRLSLILLAKRLGPKWCEKYIIKNMLLPIIEKDNIAEGVRKFCVSMLGPLLRPFPSDMKLHCEVVINALFGLLEKELSFSMKETVFMSLLYMSKHDQRRLISALLQWRPRHVSKELEELLRTFVREKPIQAWKSVVSNITF